MPQHAAGVRIEPPVSVPNATSASPVATATALPLDEPPGTRVGSSGFTGVPNHGFTPVPPNASSCRFVLPTMRAPAARAPARQAASAVAGAAHGQPRPREPAVVTTPATSMASFTASRSPSPAPSEPSDERRHQNVVTENVSPSSARWARTAASRASGHSTPSASAIGRPCSTSAAPMTACAAIELVPVGGGPGQGR